MSAWLRRLDGAELWAIALLAGFPFLLSGGPLAVSLAVSPEQIEEGVVRLSPPCPYAATGASCATCGLTRGFTAMSRLRLDDALAYNPAAPWLYFGFWVLMLASGSVLGRVAMEWRLRPSGAQSA